MRSQNPASRFAHGRTHRLAMGLIFLGALVSHTPWEARAQASPGSDIWAFRFSSSPPTLELSSQVRITARPGYDNQPHFAPGDRLVLYTAVDSAGQADIWRFDLASGERVNVTRSAPESEYSATVMPDLTRFSVIRVEADSTQRLWSFESGGTNPGVLLPAIHPVGYHAWIDGDRLAIYVLGSPATLQLASISEGTAQVVARDVGRSIHHVPGGARISFVQWAPDGSGTITAHDPDTGETEPLAPLPGDNEFYAWTPSGLLIAGQGSTLYWWKPGESEAWEEFANLESAGLLGISRVAVARGGGWIAVVAQDAENIGG